LPIGSTEQQRVPIFRGRPHGRCAGTRLRPRVARRAVDGPALPSARAGECGVRGTLSIGQEALEIGTLVEVDARRRGNFEGICGKRARRQREAARASTAASARRRRDVRAWWPGWVGDAQRRADRDLAHARPHAREGTARDARRGTKSRRSPKLMPQVWGTARASGQLERGAGEPAGARPDEGLELLRAGRATDRSRWSTRGEAPGMTRGPS